MPEVGPKESLYAVYIQTDRQPCMYVYIHIFAYTYTYTYLHLQLYVFIYIYIYMSTTYVESYVLTDLWVSR